MDRYMGRMANSGKVWTLIIITMTTHLMDKYMGRMANSGKVCTLIIITMKAKYRITLIKPETYRYIVSTESPWQSLKCTDICMMSYVQPEGTRPYLQRNCFFSSEVLKAKKCTHSLKIKHNRLYLHSHGIRLQWSIRKLWQIISNKRHWSQDGKIYFDFLGVFHRFSIKIRIEVYFFRLHWEMKGHWSCVNLWEALHASQDLHVTSVLSFPNANEKSVLQSLSVETDCQSNGILKMCLFLQRRKFTHQNWLPDCSCEVVIFTVSMLFIYGCHWGFIFA